MSKNYYNTNKTEEPQLSKSDAIAKQQKQRVWEIFKLNGARKLSTRDAHNIYLTKYEGFNKSTIQTPHDSIKRAISDLTDIGLLIKNGKEDMVDGPYPGKRIHTWKLNRAKLYCECCGAPTNRALEIDKNAKLLCNGCNVQEAHHHYYVLPNYALPGDQMQLSL